jgi:predicted RNase H-like nuclease
MVGKMKRIIGIDLAWGERMPDGLCVLDIDGPASRVIETTLTRGDAELVAWVTRHAAHLPTLLAIDAPLVCPNLTGARPVDRLTHVHFGRFHAGSHPANATRCSRPLRVVELLKRLGFELGWEFSKSHEDEKLMIEVYPHPAMVRLFDLPRRIGYKRGPVGERRVEFSRLQSLMRNLLRNHFCDLELDRQTDGLLHLPWSKNVEDQTDAFFCALIGYWHWKNRGEKSEILGDLATGFILVPTL